MGITGYTAMTAAEFQNATQLPNRLAFMACHFSCYGTGLSNLPQQLPENTMIIVNDRTPVRGHDPAVIAGQLKALYEDLQPSCFLLDFQRPDNPETSAIAEKLVKAIPCPVGVSSLYAKDLDCPVFLPPPEIDVPLKSHLAPWAGREIWLETAEDHQVATVTETGCSFSSAEPEETKDGYLFDGQVFCHYRAEYGPKAATVHLHRGKAALHTLLESAEALGVTLAVGLYQQLGADFFEKDTLRN